MKKYFKLTPATYLILKENNKVLLLRRYNTGYEDGNYSLIAGHFDGDEPATQCIIREAKEEADIIVKQENLRLVHIMHRATQQGRENERADFFFTTNSWEGKIKNTEPHKCDDLSWFPLDNLPTNTIPYIRFALESFSKNVTFSEFGWKNSV